MNMLLDDSTMTNHHNQEENSSSNDKSSSSSSRSWRIYMKKTIIRVDVIVLFILFTIVLLTSLAVSSHIQKSNAQIVELQALVNSLQVSSSTHNERRLFDEQQQQQHNDEVFKMKCEEMLLETINVKLDQMERGRIPRIKEQVQDVMEEILMNVDTNADTSTLLIGESNRDEFKEEMKSIGKLHDKKFSFDHHYLHGTSTEQFQKISHIHQKPNIRTVHDEDRRLQITPAFFQPSKGDQICDTLPFLAPISHANNFTYDQRVDRILGLFQGISSVETFSEHSTPQYKAACWILYEDTTTIIQQEKLGDFLIQRYVLVLFLYAMYPYAGVLVPLDTCDYDLVECNSDGFITRIKMKEAAAGKHRMIPSEISHLYSLEHLDLSNGNIVGTIPTQLGTLSSLKELNLDYNELRGTLPSEIGRLSALEDCSLNWNSIEGSIPSQIGRLTMLDRLSIKNNSMTGSIPSELYDCTHLRELNLIDNFYTGTISSSIIQWDKIELLHIYNNFFSGSLPSEIGGLLSMTDLQMNRNEFTGPVPNEIGNLTSIERLVLSFNHFNGTLPDVFDAITEVETFDFQNNDFSGTIPESLFHCQYNMALMIHGNDMVGSVPEHFCDELLLFQVDDSPWFLDEAKVNCKCCTKGHCYVWNDKSRSVGGTIRPKCPSTNIFSLQFDVDYWIKDVVANVAEYEFIGLDASSEVDLCLSPSGCYTVHDQIGNTQVSKRLAYNASSMSLVEQEQCEAVNICGFLIDQNHPRRKGLNHITQIALPFLSMLDDKSLKAEKKALCWLVNNDTLYQDYDICDGTLLQRYVLATFFSMSKDLDLNVFSLKPTCEWGGITCDETNKFVTGINLTNVGLEDVIVTEIGLLDGLKVIDLSSNDLRGTIDPIIFANLRNLEVFNADNNNLSGEIPKELFELHKLREVRLKGNVLGGKLPEDIKYSENLEIISLKENIIQGTIPLSLTKCHRLQELDLSRNNFIDGIPSELGNLSELKIIKLSNNRLRGSIPRELFTPHNIEKLMLQSNLITGSIPTEIGSSNSLTFVTMNHNTLQGTIPLELGLLEKLDYLHLHHNQLTGTAPTVNFKNLRENSFISDCGSPHYLLPGKLECPSCSMCCNSEDKCLENTIISPEIWVVPACASIIIPILFGIIFYLIHKFSNIMDKRDTMAIVNMDSAYCLVFANNFIAWLVYAGTACFQVILLYNYLLASDPLYPKTDWEFNIRCHDRGTECATLSKGGQSGWIILFVLNVLYMGVDALHGILQIRKSVFILDLRLFFSGTVMAFLVLFFLATTVLYNNALAQTTTNMIMNAVILLFITEIDEKVFDLMETIAPDWTALQIEEVESYFTKKVNSTDQDLENNDSDDNEDNDDAAIETKLESATN